MMFHHFHSDQHPVGQGSISDEQLDKLIARLKTEFLLLNAEEFRSRLMRSSLPRNAICLTFDDSLKCQYDIALPVLDVHRIKAFFFIYSSALTEDPPPLEVYRWFRSVCYSTFSDFYTDFVSTCALICGEQALRELSTERASTYLADDPVYALEDRQFRFLRDRVLTEEQYSSVMSQMMSERLTPSPLDLHDQLFMSSSDILKIRDLGHEVGLHSHSHPLHMQELPISEQDFEYKRNKEVLEALLAKDVSSMSHPMGRYSDETLKVLTRLGIRIGFRSDYLEVESRSNLEVARVDHAVMVKELVN